MYRLRRVQPAVRGASGAVTLAETSAPDEDKGKLAERQRKAFNRSIAAALDSKTLFACEREAKRLIWLP